MDNKNIYQYKDMDFTVCDILLIHERKCSPTWRRDIKDRPLYAVIVVTNGQAYYTFGHNTYTVKKGDIYFLPKGSSYSVVADASQSFDHISSDFHLLDDSFPLLPLPQIYKTRNLSYYIDTFMKLIRIWTSKEIGHRVKCKAILQNMLVHIFTENIFEDAFCDFARLQPAIDYIESNFDNQIKTENLADLVSLSIPHFRRLFKKVFGVSPIKYLEDLRISNAKDLIISGMYSIGEIAEKVGFCDIYYFSRVFKNITGMSPTDFRSKTKDL